MSTQEERIFVVGGTGTVGSIVVQGLIESGAQVTIYTRSPQKVPEASTVSIAQGDYSDWTPLEKALPGHTRLFLLVGDIPGMTEIKIDVAKRAYAAGVKQVVEVSAKRLPFRDYTLTDGHILAEDAVYAIPNRGAYVSLRPTNFMTNQLYFTDMIKEQNILVDSAAPDEPQEYISPRDIATAAVRILREPIDKHNDAAYELIGDVRTSSERAAYLSKSLGRTITYKQLPVQEIYEMYRDMGWNHAISYYLATYQHVSPVSRGLPLLLGRCPESYEEWTEKNKALFE
ncbi:hypothetical protein BJV82DRAFT_668462 [Fennellomyces sp. T-0311]|nr:hypothetical protein BJV82DRAFT_668462 [Fennellomyces sp. T-0311]